MIDRYTDFAQSAYGAQLIKALNLPNPPKLERNPVNPARPIEGLVVIGASEGGSNLAAATKVIEAMGGELRSAPNTFGAQEANAAAGRSVPGLPADDSSDKAKAVVFDASGIETIEGLRGLYDFFHTMVARIGKNARVVVLGSTPEDQKTVARTTAQRALEGFTRSLAKEVGKRGATVQLVYVAAGAEDQLEGPLRFLLSPRSAYVSGQVLRVVKAKKSKAQIDWNKPLAGKTALVTGAARGIGESIARTLARDGAKVMVLDIPPAKDALEAVAADIGGVALTEDITDGDAPQTIAKALKDAFGGVDIVIHNAGVTRDKTLARMKPQFWDMVMNINLLSLNSINTVLLEEGIINADGRIMGVSSIGGIAGNFGQTNYGTSKAGVIGYVESLAKEVKSKGITVNAVAPGFIETQMTAQMPFGPREAGRRLNSMSQGGLADDIAETVAFFSSPASSGVTGQVLRACGQSLIGA